MKTAEEWTKEWFNGATPEEVGEDEFAKTVQYFNAIMLDSYRAGMEAAAKRVDELADKMTDSRDKRMTTAIALVLIDAAKTAQLPQ